MTNRMGPAGPQSASQLKSPQRILFFVSTSRIFWHLHPEEPWLVELKASVQNGSAFGVCRLWLSLGTSRADAVGPGRPLSCPPNSQVEKRRPRNGGGGTPGMARTPRLSDFRVSTELCARCCGEPSALDPWGRVSEPGGGPLCLAFDDGYDSGTRSAPVQEAEDRAQSCVKTKSARWVHLYFVLGHWLPSAVCHGRRLNLLGDSCLPR